MANSRHITAARLEHSPLIQFIADLLALTPEARQETLRIGKDFQSHAAKRNEEAVA